MKILLITPPFCQLNTPYPATAFLKSWLTREGHEVRQVDSGLEVFLTLFSREGLKEVFDWPAELSPEQEADEIRRIRDLQDRYIETVDTVMAFLQGGDNGMATLLARPGYLPEGERFIHNSPETESFGALGITDLARFRGTLYLEDLGDFISRTVDEDFGFSRYAERIALSPPSFDEIAMQLEYKKSLIDDYHRAILSYHIEEFQPDLAGFSIPFPGNLIQALRGAAFIREAYPGITVCAGGGYVSTELRELKDPRLLDYFHYITLDDGEDTTTALAAQLEKRKKGEAFNPEELIRTYFKDEEGFYYSGSDKPDKTEEGGCSHKNRPAPDYSDLPLDSYLSLTDRQNPMHRLWSEGPWLKMMLAHGCYWHRCAFCDTSLDYICRYEPGSASVLVDQMEELIEKTGKRSFHFVDEAAPPKLLKDLALELIARGLAVTWWTNIRFEKQFTPDLCRLMARSGCIAVSGGLEVASDRMLDMIEKGVTVEQVVNVTRAFREAEIMVHAYLMYGFPGQDEKELMDALETIRQMFAAGLIQSAYWHQFALTAHSPAGKNPGRYGITIESPPEVEFARNDLLFKQESPDLSAYGEGLRTALFNYMNDRGLDMPLKSWFSFRTPPAGIRKKWIAGLLKEPFELDLKNSSRLVWSENPPQLEGETLIFRGNSYQELLPVPREEGLFIMELLKRASLKKSGDKGISVTEAEELAPEFGVDGKVWIEGPMFQELMDYGLLIL